MVKFISKVHVVENAIINPFKKIQSFLNLIDRIISLIKVRISKAKPKIIKRTPITLYKVLRLSGTGFHGSKNKAIMVAI